MKHQNLAFAIVTGLFMAASIGCTPDRDNVATTPPAANTQPTPAAPMETAPAAITPASATANLMATDNMKIAGALTLTARDNGVNISGTISGLTPDTEHGFHIHETGDCVAPDFKSAGGHFNPGAMEHGNPNSQMHHAGDMMNLSVNADGSASMDVTVPGVTLGDGSATDVMNRAIVIHAMADDYTSQPAGDAGDRIACGVIAK